MACKTINRRQAYEYLKQLETSGKTPISVAMELATKLGVVADFKETSELKWSNSSFKYIAKLGDIQAVGVGSSKKEAKQNSAKELIKLIKNESENFGPPSSPSPTQQNDSFSSPVSSLLCGGFKNSMPELCFIPSTQKSQNKWLEMRKCAHL